VISNNNRCPRIAAELGIAEYIEAFFTPRMHPGYRPKPDRSLFDAARLSATDIGPATAVMVGDDPWSDGALAGLVGLQCWLVDRRSRYDALALPSHVIRVPSLQHVLAARRSPQSWSRPADHDGSGRDEVFP
jgi:FMN phosphatase YigB (HAD superfamily)